MPDELLRSLDASRAAFLDALGEVDADLVTVPGVMEDWSVRDLVVHVAAWAEHGADALALATAGRGEEFAYSTAETDAMNARILADARSTSPADALAREEAAYIRFRQAVETLDDVDAGAAAREWRHGRRGDRVRRPGALRRAHRAPARLVRRGRLGLICR